MNTSIDLRLVELKANLVNLVHAQAHSFKTGFLLNALLELPLNYPNSGGGRPSRPIPVSLVIGETSIEDAYAYLNSQLDKKFKRVAEEGNDIHHYFQHYGYILEVISVPVDELPRQNMLDVCQRAQGGFVFIDGIVDDGFFKELDVTCNENQVTVLATTNIKTTATTHSSAKEKLASYMSSESVLSEYAFANNVAIAIEHESETENTTYLLLTKDSSPSVVRRLPLDPLTAGFWVTTPQGENTVVDV